MNSVSFVALVGAEAFVRKRGGKLDIVAGNSTSWKRQRNEGCSALCWLLYWGSFTGNTLNTFFGLFGKTKSKRADADTLFMAAFTAYYFVMFYGIIGLVGLVLKQCPKVPKPVNMVFGVVLATLAGGLGFVPVGLLGMLVGAKDPFENKKAD